MKSWFVSLVHWKALALAMVLDAAVVHAEIRLGTPFKDHAVLQREKPLPVWGWANPGERVRVALGDAMPVETIADGDGTWRVVLPPQPASTTALKLVAEGGNGITVSDVLVGEVWLCSGQSNMEWRVRFSATAEEDIAGANLPHIRQLKVMRNPRTARQDDAAAEWAVCSPETAGDFSAVGFHFARELWESLHIPIGLINCSHGNSSVKAWMSAEALAGNPEFHAVADRWAEVMARHPAAVARYAAALKQWEADAAAGGQTRNKPAPPVGPNHQQEPAALFNGMIAPVAPTALRGFVWYQGEGNARRAGEYEKLLGALIRQWRQDFDAPDAPFFWVQLPGLERMPPTTTHDDWIALREATTATLALPATGQAITIDVGDRTDIHPTRKREVGERLARLARRRVYGEAVEDSGPELVRAAVTTGGVELEFSHASGGLQLSGEATEAFELAGEDGRFLFADDVEILDDSRIRLSVRSVARPMAVRHAWRAYPTGWLANGEGLPAAPFSRPINAARLLSGSSPVVAADPALPNVLILGDSISIGYTPHVRQGLEGKAIVLRPDANCGDTNRGLASLDKWLEGGPWRVIHFNWGLHDLCYRNPQSKAQGKRDKVNGKQSVPIEEYEKNLEAIVGRLEKTGARLIFATTTVVPEGEVGRFVGDDERYNAAAVRVMRKHGVVVNDLHATSKAFPAEFFVGPGDVHFTAQGSAELAEQVTAAMEQALP